MTTPGGVPNLPQGALTLDTLAPKLQDMSGDAMKSRAVERFPSIFNTSTGLDPALDITPFGILTRIWAEVNSLIANADPADIQGPEDLPELVLEFIEGLPVVGQLVGLLEAILGTYDGDDEVLLAVQEIFAPIRTLLQLLTGISSGFPTSGDVTSGWGGLANAQNLIQTIVDTLLGNEESTGLPFVSPGLDLVTLALQFIPSANVTGAGGMPNVLSTFTTLWDTLASAFSLTDLSGVTLPGLAGAAQTTASNANDASLLTTLQQNTLNIRTNNPVMGALERTTVSNFNLNQLGTASTPSNVPVTQAASLAALVRMPQSDTKGTFYWLGSGNSSITSFFLNFGKMALDGSVTPLFSSGNLVGQLTSGWQWQSYTFAGADQIVHSASENIVAEFQVIGAGTHSVAGLDLQWLQDHPAATTKKGATTRNTGSSGAAPLSISAGSASFTTKTPWVGLGRADVPGSYIPPQLNSYTTSGTYTRPSWLVNGDLLDVFLVAAGGGGQSGGYGVPGKGGGKGQWQTRTFVMGSDIHSTGLPVIPLSTTVFTHTLGASGAGGLNPFLLNPGNTATNSTVTATSMTTITATGGIGGGRSGSPTGQTGQAAGNQTIVDYTAVGGAEAGVNQAGNAPGGGGGSGYPAVGRDGGAAKVWYRARQG